MTDPPGASGSRFLRQFALTNGRARSIGLDLPLESLVQTAVDPARTPNLPVEQREILELARSPLAIAEIAAHLRIHLGIARVLVSDLAAEKLVVVQSGVDSADGPDLATLERLLDELKAL